AAEIRPHGRSRPVRHHRRLDRRERTDGPVKNICRTPEPDPGHAVYLANWLELKNESLEIPFGFEGPSTHVLGLLSLALPNPIPQNPSLAPFLLRDNVPAIS